MTEQVTFQLRRGNSTGATGWTTLNPILASGEPGFELDTTTLKIGNGSTNWNNLDMLSYGTKVAVGRGTGFNQGANSIAIGNQPGSFTQPANTIILNATGSGVSGISGQTGSCYIAPIRGANTNGNQLLYNTLTKEITYNTNVTQTIGITGGTGIGVTLNGTTYTISSTTVAVSIPANSVLFSDGSGISGNTGFQYSTSGITLGKLNIQSSPYPATIGIGYAAGKGGQGVSSIAIGQDSGNGQGDYSVAIGYAAGQTRQEQFTVAVGNNAGITGQKERAVAVGNAAGNANQDTGCIAIGDSAGYTGQKQYSVAIGPGAGYLGQGDFSIAIGINAGVNNQPPNSICLNANSAILDPSFPNSFSVKPIRTDLTQTTPLCYNSTTGEIVVGSRTTTGSWTLTTGANPVSLTVPLNDTYSIWVRGNIPSGIVVYTATVVVTNSNVPVIGTSYGWYYVAGNALVLTSIPSQVIGTANNIITAVVPTVTANVFDFVITNNSGTSQVVNWGYTKL